VSIAAGRFTDRARRWWKETKALHGDDNISWTQFRTLFLDEYVSKAHREEKCKELDRLQQGNMTVQEYREKFEKLSVYKESFRTYPKDKMSKFIDGLKWNYQAHLSVHEHSSYKALVEAALRLDSRARFIEPLRRNHQANNQAQKRSHDNRNTSSNASHITNNNSQDQSSFSRKKFRPYENRQPKSVHSAPPTTEFTCYYCGKPGHKKVNCPMLLKVGDPRATGFRNSGGNTYTGGDRGGNRTFQVQGRGNVSQPAQSQISHTKAQASSQPERVYAILMLA
jgi:hypothetical protein